MKHLNNFILFESTKTSHDLGRELYDRIESYSIDEINDLIKKGADVNFIHWNGWTSLMEASSEGRYTVVQKLIEAGAKLDLQDRYGRTALFVAEASIKQLLIESGANMTLKNKEDKDFIDCRNYNGTIWLYKYETQKLIMKKEPNMYKSLVRNDIKIDPKIKKEYSEFIMGLDLNLL